jgi:hypothetical protein
MNEYSLLPPYQARILRSNRLSFHAPTPPEETQITPSKWGKESIKESKFPFLKSHLPEPYVESVENTKNSASFQPLPIVPYTPKRNKVPVPPGNPKAIGEAKSLPVSPHREAGARFLSPPHTETSTGALPRSHTVTGNSAPLTSPQTNNMAPKISSGSASGSPTIAHRTPSETYYAPNVRRQTSSQSQGSETSANRTQTVSQSNRPAPFDAQFYETKTKESGSALSGPSMNQAEKGQLGSSDTGQPRSSNPIASGIQTKTDSATGNKSSSKGQKKKSNASWGAPWWMQIIIVPVKAAGLYRSAGKHEKDQSETGLSLFSGNPYSQVLSWLPIGLVFAAVYLIVLCVIPIAQVIFGGSVFMTDYDKFMEIRPMIENFLPNLLSESLWYMIEEKETALKNGVQEVHIQNDNTGDNFVLDESTLLLGWGPIEPSVQILDPLINTICMIRRFMVSNTEDFNADVASLLSHLYRVEVTEHLEYCTHEEGHPELPVYADCGTIHAGEDCLNEQLVVHTEYTCATCDTVGYRCLGHPGEHNTSCPRIFGILVCTDQHLWYHSEELMNSACTNSVEDMECSTHHECSGHFIRTYHIQQQGFRRMWHEVFQIPMDEIYEGFAGIVGSLPEYISLRQEYSFCLKVTLTDHIAADQYRNTEYWGFVEMIPGERESNPAMFNQAMHYRENTPSVSHNAWAGNILWKPWAVTFVARCASDIGAEEIPLLTDAQELLEYYFAKGRFSASKYIVPSMGELVFTDWDEDGLADHVGILWLSDGTHYYCIEGNNVGEVRNNCYPINSKVVLGVAWPVN